MITDYNVYSNSYTIQKKKKKQCYFLYLILNYYILPKILFFSNHTILGMCVSFIREVTVLLQQPYWFLPPIRSSRRVRSRRREKKQKTPGSKKKKKKKNLLVSFWLLLLLWWWRQRCWKLPLALLCTSSVAWKFPLVCECARSCHRRYCCCYWLCRRPPPRTMASLCPLPWPSMPGDSHSPWAAAADTTGHHCYYSSCTFWRKFPHPTIYK